MKKELTITQKKNRCRALQYTLFGAEYVSVVTPYAIMAGVNAEEWFVTNPEPWKIGLGGALGMSLVGLSVFLVTKKRDNDKLTDGMLSLVLIWYTIAFVFYLLAKVNMEIYTMMFYGGFGLLGALGLNVGSKSFEKKADRMKTANEEAQAQLDKEQAIEEIKTVKVRVKK